jgi:hypothetical protein
MRQGNASTAAMAVRRPAALADRRFDHRLERIEAVLLVMIDLTDQDQRIAHQNAGKGDQADSALMPNG